jgi:hypothetical protein
MARTEQTARKSNGPLAPSTIPSRTIKAFNWPQDSPQESLQEPLQWRPTTVSYLPTERINTNTSFLTSAAQLPASESRASPFQRKGRNLALPLVIRGYRILAVADTGSDIDAIGLDLVEDLCLQGTRIAKRCKKVRLGDGYVLHAIGKVSVRCSFDRGDEAQFRRTFFVFPKLSNQVELIIGRRFLSQTQTLTKHQDRLEEIPYDSTTIPKVMSMAIPKRRFACYINSTLVLANADTGSEINLIKEEYAIERGFAVLPVTEEEKYAQLPGDRLAIITGKTTTRLDTLHAAPPAGASLEPSSEAGAHCWVEYTTMSSVNPQEPNRLTTFYILPSLPCNVLLSQQLLDSINAFTTHSNSFVDFTTKEREVEDLAHIKWLNALERKLMGKSITTATWPPASVRGQFNPRSLSPP